ncbi:hypothetical protein Poli38472_002449 [Pythium oligandrum]|uniref:Protein kinase domain-containing protein n=1 Tax=Pythium oligandrum TaxID=41045 RepID=A0A8K1FMC0_PYTOL|nr:hypothetical protein Poli38472_002449 [Pythium oligandrum]|eukprot:TMW63508.1 hypothetical protein Poli38472_002449 [Pythium oligandrum]
MENYNIYDEIGRGRHSFVYKARRKRSVEFVAVKSTAKSRMEKILNEVQILHRLHSRYVLKFFNWYESQNHIWIIFEYCIGGDLLNLITQDRQLPEPTVKAFGWELMAGLQYLHSNGILFCDLKPANVLIDEAGSLKLADFGLARRIPTNDTARSKPLEHGTPTYMAPELFQQPPIHSFASEFWALGCLLFELCTGRAPFTHTIFPELVRMIQTVPVELPPPGFDMSPLFANLLGRLLEKDPYKRITWEELVHHPFWTDLPKLEHVELPPQQLFEAARPDRHNELAADSESVAIAEAPALVGTSKQEQQLSETNDGDNTVSGGTSEDDEEQVTGGQHDDEPSDHSDESDRDSGKSDEKQAARVRPVSAPAQVLASRPIIRQNGEVSDRETGKMEPKAEEKNGLHRKAPNTAPPGPITKRKVSDGAPRGWNSTLKKAPRLLFTATDCTVKPIAFSLDIEDVDLPSVDPQLLEFEEIHSDTLLTCPTEELEDHLKSIYISLKSPEASAEEMANVLSYLFKLCLKPKLANVIVNSSILTLLTRLLTQLDGREHDATSLLISKITLVLGVLFRFATFIAATSPEQIQSLVLSLEDNLANQRESQVMNMKRRSASSCLGELLFYSATQKGGGVPHEGIECILPLLEDSDSVVAHYAIRTLSNILARCLDSVTLQKLINENLVLALQRTLASCDLGAEDSIPLRTTVTQALAQVFRHVRFPTSKSFPPRMKTALLMLLSRPNALDSLWRGVQSERVSLDLAIASFNVLNGYLEMGLESDRDGEDQAHIGDHRRILLEKIANPAQLRAILDTRSRFDEDMRNSGRTDAIATAPTDATDRRYHGDDDSLPGMLRAKTLLFVYFGMHRSKKFVEICISESILLLVERSLSPYASSIRSPQPSPTKASPSSAMRRLSRVDQYVVDCGLNAIRFFIRTALKLGAECISGRRDIDYEVEREHSTISAAPFGLFEQLLKHPICRSQVVGYFLANKGKEFTFFIRLMAKLLTSFSGEGLLAMGGTVGGVISGILLRLFQSSSTEAAALLSVEASEIFSHLLPALVTQLQEVGSAEDNETEDEHKVNCIRLVYSILLHLDPEFVEHDEQLKVKFLSDHLLPCFESLLDPSRQSENVWRFSVELLFGLASQDDSHFQEIVSLDLAKQVVALLGASASLRENTLPPSVPGVVKLFVDWAKKTQQLGLLYRQGLATHVLAALESVCLNDDRAASTCELLDILYQLLYSRYEDHRKAKGSLLIDADFEPLVRSGPILLQLCARSTENSSQLAKTSEKKSKDPSAPSDVVEVSSRCLVYLSQIFGEKLNNVLFTGSSQKKGYIIPGTDGLDRCIVLILKEQASDSPVLLRLLLTLKNCLRCDGATRSGTRSGNSQTLRWLTENADVLLAVRRITKGVLATKASRDANTTQEQIKKTAAEIVRLAQASSTKSPHGEQRT